MAAVEFFDGDRPLGRQDRAPYALSLNLSSADNGPHSHLARAHDAAGNSGSSGLVGVSVNIQTPTPSGATPQFIGASGQLYGQGTPARLTLPAGTRSGDALIASVAAGGDASNALSAPAGFTRLTGFPLAGGGSAVVTLWVYGGTAGGAARLTFGSAQPATLRAVLPAYRGADPAGLQEAHSVVTTPAASVTAPSLAAPAGSVLLRTGSLAPANHTRRLIVPAGLSPRYGIGLDARFVLAVADEVSERGSERPWAVLNRSDPGGREQPAWERAKSNPGTCPSAQGGMASRDQAAAATFRSWAAATTARKPRPA